MVTLKNSKIIVLIVMILLGLTLTQGSAIAQDAWFFARIDWGDFLLADDDNCTMEMITRDGQGEIVDFAPMIHGVPDANGVTLWWIGFDPSSTSVTWEVEVTPLAVFPTNVIVDGDAINFMGNNDLDEDFAPGQ